MPIHIILAIDLFESRANKIGLTKGSPHMKPFRCTAENLITT